MTTIRKNKKRILQSTAKAPYDPLMKAYQGIKYLKFKQSLLFNLVFDYMLSLEGDEELVTAIYTDLFNIHRNTYKNADSMFEQSVVSQQLARGRHIGLYTSRRDGKNIYYSIDQKGYSKLKRVFRLIKEELK